MNSFYNEILTEHHLRPNHRGDLTPANLIRRGVNPSCGDDLTLRLQTENGVITDGAFTGDGCAISRASADMMLDLVIGKTREDALALSETFHNMILGRAEEADEEALEEAACLRDISHMPSRVKCAMLAWRTLNEALKEGEASSPTA